MTDSPRHPAHDLKTDELRALCRRKGLHPTGGLSKASRPDLLNWVIMNGFLGPIATAKDGK